MKFLLTALLLCWLAPITHAQLSDRLWLGGYAEFPDVAGYGHFTLRFQDGAVQVQPMPLTFQFESTVAVAADTAGQLLFYANGCAVANRQHEIMPNGQGLNPGSLSDQVCPGKGYVVPQGAMVLPMPGDSNRYCLLHLGAAYEPGRKLRLGPLYYTIVDMSLQNGLGEVVSKNNLLLDGDLGAFTVIRHGNGRDWWVLVPEFGNRIWHTWLLSTQGLAAMPPQTIALAGGACEHYAQTATSPDGSRIANWGDCRVTVLDFDRCAGLLDGPLELAAPTHWFAGGGVAFSPSGRYLYATSHTVLFRADLAANAPQLDTMRFSYDPYLHSPYDVPGNSFHYLVNGPDGKIYGNIPSRARYLHTLKNPDGASIANIGFAPQNISLPVTNVRTLPHFPNFRLYDLFGSPCDTLGIDGPSVAAHEPDRAAGLGFGLAPNPADAAANVHFWQPFSGTLCLVDALGRVQRQQRLDKSSSTTLECQGLPNGIYYLQVQKENGTTRSARLVIVHE